MLTQFDSHLKLWIQANRPKKSAAANQRHRPPHLEDEYRPPLFESDVDIGRSTSPSSDSFDEAEVAPTKPPPIQFETAAEGTAALQAFFFGGAVPIAVPAEKRREEPVESEEEEQDPIDSSRYRTVTPPLNYPTRPQQQTIPHDPSPILAFERQRPLVQPKPKASTTQTNLLLALLTNKDPVASPPPSRNARPVVPATTTDHPLLSNLDNLFSQAAPPPPLPHYADSLPSLAYLTAPTSITPVDPVAQQKLEKRSMLLSVLNDLTFSNPGSVASPSSVASAERPSPRIGEGSSNSFGHSPQHAMPNHFPSTATLPPIQQASKVEARSNLMSILNHAPPPHRVPDQDSSQAPAVVGHTPQQRQMLSLLQQSTFNAPPIPMATREENNRPPMNFGPPQQQQFPPPLPPFAAHHTAPVNRQPFPFPPNQLPQQYLPQQLPPPPFAHPQQHQQQYPPFPPPPHHHHQPQFQQQPPPPLQHFSHPPPNTQFLPILAPRFVSPPSLPPLAPAPIRSVDFPSLPSPVPINPIKTQQSKSLLSIFNRPGVEA